jgi:hypothetical protein
MTKYNTDITFLNKAFKISVHGSSTNVSEKQVTPHKQ